MEQDFDKEDLVNNGYTYHKYLFSHKFKFQLTTICIPLILIICYYFRYPLLHLVYQMPPCLVYYYYGIYCPSCGSTRSMAALFQGDFLLALHYNLIPALFFILCILAYLEFACYSFGKKIRILPRKPIIYIIGFILLIIYIIARNLIPALFPE